jgi:hypothetical protein
MFAALALRPENPTKAAVLQALKDLDARLAALSAPSSRGSKTKP